VTIAPAPARAAGSAPTPSALFRLARFALVVLLLPGCALVARDRWDETRRQVIEPINAAFHRHLPRELKARDLDALAAHYATERIDDLDWTAGETVGGGFTEEVRRWHGARRAETVRAHYERILALLPTIEKAELRILRVHWQAPEPAGLRTDARLIVRGADGGERRQLDQRMTLWIARGEGPWRITRQEVVGREVVATARPHFEVATSAAGIDDVHDTTGSPPFRVIGGAFARSGSTVGDVDGDGDEDVVLASVPRLVYYRNRGDGTFEEATAAVGLPAAFPGLATGVLLFDYDDDGRPDLWVSAIAPSDRLYHNQGGVFRDVTAAAGIRPGRWASMPLAADYDRDGDLDVFVTRMGDQENTPPDPNYQAENGLPDTLYRNDGDGTFTDVSVAAGVADPGWGLAAAWGDYDADGWPDLFVGNEFGPDKLFKNRGDGTFVNVAKEAGTADRGAAMGAAWGDVDNDGDLDLFVSNMFANSSWLLFHPDFPRPVPWYLRFFTERIRQVTHEITRGSSLFLNDGDGTFSDASDAAGVRDGQWGWGAEFLDYNDDGRLDIYATNGFVSGPLLDDV
jgi:hypothetical protein